jgi:hypothetical protein
VFFGKSGRLVEGTQGWPVSIIIMYCFGVVLNSSWLTPPEVKEKTGIVISW